MHGLKEDVQGPGQDQIKDEDKEPTENTCLKKEKRAIIIMENPVIIAIFRSVVFSVSYTCIKSPSPIC